MPFGPWAIVAAGLLLLVGCSDSRLPVTWNEWIKQNYENFTLSGAAVSPGIRVSVVGETFGSNRTELSDRLAEIISKSHFGPQVKFASRINDDDSYRDFEVRVLLSPATNARAETMCTDESFKQQTPKPGTVVLMAAYCRKGRRINSVRGRVNGEIDTPAFEQLVRVVSHSLFPPPGYSHDGRFGKNFR